MNPEFDTNSLGQLLESRYGLVLGVVRRYAPDHDLAMEIVQQTFFVFFQGLTEGKWTLQSNIDALLHGIARNTALEFLRIEQKNTPEALQIISSRLLRAVNESGELNLPEEGYERSEARLLALKNCMDKLTPQNREFFDSHYWDGNTIESIAKSHGIQPNVLRLMFSRLRAKLRDCIEENIFVSE